MTRSAACVTGSEKSPPGGEIAAPGCGAPAVVTGRDGRSDGGAEPAPDDAVAIVGMSGRFPGAPDVEVFWRNLRDGVDGISEVTRWDHEAYFDPRDARDKTYSRWGGFLPEVDRFDSGFFAVSPRIRRTEPSTSLHSSWRASPTRMPVA